MPVYNGPSEIPKHLEPVIDKALEEAQIGYPDNTDLAIAFLFEATMEMMKTIDQLIDSMSVMANKLKTINDLSKPPDD